MSLDLAVTADSSLIRMPRLLLLGKVWLWASFLSQWSFSFTSASDPCSHCEIESFVYIQHVTYITKPLSLIVVARCNYSESEDHYIFPRFFIFLSAPSLASVNQHSHQYSIKTAKCIKLFSPSGSHTILVFPYQMVWQYSNGDSLIGALNARKVWKNRDFLPISRFISEMIQDRAIVTIADW